MYGSIRVPFQSIWWASLWRRLACEQGAHALVQRGILDDKKQSAPAILAAPAVRPRERPLLVHVAKNVVGGSAIGKGADASALALRRQTGIVVSRLRARGGWLGDGTPQTRDADLGVIPVRRGNALESKSHAQPNSRGRDFHGPRHAERRVPTGDWRGRGGSRNLGSGPP